MKPNLDRRQALVVLQKIDEILAWEKTKDRERDVRFIELGQYLCEVRARQYWRVENLKSFDEFLEKRFPESRRKAYYLMAIHENLTNIPKQRLREIGWRKAAEMVKVARHDGEGFDCAPWAARRLYVAAKKLRPTNLHTGRAKLQSRQMIKAITTGSKGEKRNPSRKRFRDARS